MLDLEGEYLFVSGVDNDFYCLQSDNGKEVWKAQEGSQIMAQPYVFEADDRRKVVYVIESENGRVRQYDLYSGRRYWDYSCADISNQFCQDPVEAEFAMTPSGNTIYYGDIYGRIFSLDVANFETESPTIAPTSIPTIKPSAQPTITPPPTGAEVPTQMVQEDQDTPSPTNDAGSSIQVIIIDGDIDRNDISDSDPFTEVKEGNNTVAATSFDQKAFSNSSNKVAAYVGAAIAGLCVLMIPFILFSILRRRRKKASSSSNMVVEIIDDCSSCDLESQSDLEYFNSIETKNSSDPNNGDGIEVEIIQHVATRRNKTKMNKGKKGKLPDTPNTVNSLESIDESPIVVAEPSVEAVNLRQTFDRAVDSQAVAHVEDNVDDSKDFSDDDIPPPPPDGEESPISSSKEWTWSSLLQIGTVQSSKSMKNSSEISLKKASDDPDLKQSALGNSPTPDISLTEKATLGRNEIASDERPSVHKESILPIKKMKWRKKGKKNSLSSLSESQKDSAENDHSGSLSKMNQNKESQTPSNKELVVEREADESPIQSEKNEQSEEPLKEDIPESAWNVTEKEKKGSETLDISTENSTPPPETPTSPSTYSMFTEAIQSLSPVRSLQSVQESLLSSNQSSTKSVGSDDESLYTSYTGGTHEKKQEIKELSPLSNYVYNQDVHRRDRSEIINEDKEFLTQPVLSKYYGTIAEEEHPDDERSIAPGNQYLSEERNGQKYGRSVRSKRDSNSFKSTSSTENEFSHTPLAEMYDQLAAIGQQRREERKPGFKRRNKRLEREGIAPEQEQQQEGDTWGSFLNELAEAEKEFFKPRNGQRMTLPNKNGSEDGDDTELAQINDVDNK